VPLFVLVIELLGMYTGDSRYDDMAHEFMKISITAYSITALFGGTLALSLFLLYPDLMGLFDACIRCADRWFTPYCFFVESIGVV